MAKRDDRGMKDPIRKSGMKGGGPSMVAPGDGKVKKAKGASYYPGSAVEHADATSFGGKAKG